MATESNNNEYKPTEGEITLWIENYLGDKYNKVYDNSIQDIIHISKQNVKNNITDIELRKRAIIEIIKIQKKQQSNNDKVFDEYLEKNYGMNFNNPNNEIIRYKNKNSTNTKKYTANNIRKSKNFIEYKKTLNRKQNAITNEELQLISESNLQTLAEKYYGFDFSKSIKCPGYYEEQEYITNSDSNSKFDRLLCAKHTMNNLFGINIFVHDEETPNLICVTEKPKPDDAQIQFNLPSYARTNNILPFKFKTQRNDKNKVEYDFGIFNAINEYNRFNMSGKPKSSISDKFGNGNGCIQNSYGEEIYEFYECIFAEIKKKKTVMNNDYSVNNANNANSELTNYTKIGTDFHVIAEIIQSESLHGFIIHTTNHFYVIKKIKDNNFTLIDSKYENDENDKGYNCIPGNNDSTILHIKHIYEPQIHMAKLNNRLQPTIGIVLKGKVKDSPDLKQLLLSLIDNKPKLSANPKLSTRSVPAANISRVVPTVPTVSNVSNVSNTPVVHESQPKSKPKSIVFACTDLSKDSTLSKANVIHPKNKPYNSILMDIEQVLNSETNKKNAYFVNNSVSDTYVQYENTKEIMVDNKYEFEYTEENDTEVYIENNSLTKFILESIQELEVEKKNGTRKNANLNLSCIVFAGCNDFMETLLSDADIKIKDIAKDPNSMDVIISNCLQNLLIIYNSLKIDGVILNYKQQSENVILCSLLQTLNDENFIYFITHFALYTVFCIFFENRRIEINTINIGIYHKRHITDIEKYKVKELITNFNINKQQIIKTITDKITSLTQLTIDGILDIVKEILKYTRYYDINFTPKAKLGIIECLLQENIISKKQHAVLIAEYKRFNTPGSHDAPGSHVAPDSPVSPVAPRLSNEPQPETKYFGVMRHGIRLDKDIEDYVCRNISDLEDELGIEISKNDKNKINTLTDAIKKLTYWDIKKGFHESYNRLLRPYDCILDDINIQEYINNKNETLSNIYGRILGSAYKIKKININFDVIISSPLRRCWQTAFSMSGWLGIGNIVIDENLIEEIEEMKRLNNCKKNQTASDDIMSYLQDINKPDINNKNESRLETEINYMIKQYDSNIKVTYTKFNTKYGRKDDILRREKIFSDLQEQYKDKSVLVVTHGGIINYGFMPKMLQSDLRDIGIGIYSADEGGFVIVEREKNIEGEIIMDRFPNGDYSNPDFPMSYKMNQLVF